MTEYRKYMFDNFVVEDIKNDVGQTSEDLTQDESSDSENITIEKLATIEETIFDNEVVSDDTKETEKVEELSIEEVFIEPVHIEPENKEEQIIEPSYSKEELEQAVKTAEEVAYQRGLDVARNDIMLQQNQLLDDIRNQLMTIFAQVEQKTSEIEEEALKFAVKSLRKILPTLEQEHAASEIKQFLGDNFTNFSAQETLSFAFNPNSIPLVADSLGRLAEQNDFEGKISVHKDISLGPSDCRVEWKSGGVEKNSNAILTKIENLIDNKQERENG